MSSREPIRILLVKPYQPANIRVACPPLGLLYLAATMRQTFGNDVEVRLLDQMLDQSRYYEAREILTAPPTNGASTDGTLERTEPPDEGDRIHPGRINHQERDGSAPGLPRQSAVRRTPRDRTNGEGIPHRPCLVVARAFLHDEAQAPAARVPKAGM